MFCCAMRHTEGESNTSVWRRGYMAANAIAFAPFPPPTSTKCRTLDRSTNRANIAFACTEMPSIAS